MIISNRTETAIRVEIEEVMDRVAMETKNTGDSREVQVTIANGMIVKGRNLDHHIKESRTKVRPSFVKYEMLVCKNVWLCKNNGSNQSIFIFPAFKIEFESNVYVVYRQEISIRGSFVVSVLLIGRSWGFVG